MGERATVGGMIMGADMRRGVSSFFFNDTATTEIYTLSLHDALPISPAGGRACRLARGGRYACRRPGPERRHARSLCNWSSDRKRTRLNSSHTVISYAVFCLAK